MTTDEALAIADASTVDLWKRCRRREERGEYLNNPDSLRRQALDTLAETVRAAVTLAADYLGVDDPVLRSLACVQAAVEHAERLRADVVQQAARIAELEGTLKAEQDRAALFGKGFSDYHYLRQAIHADNEEPPETLAEAVARVHALYLRGEQQAERIAALEAALRAIISRCDVGKALAIIVDERENCEFMEQIAEKALAGKER